MRAEELYQRATVVSRADLAVGMDDADLMRGLARQLGWELQIQKSSDVHYSPAPPHDEIDDLPEAVVPVQSSRYPANIADVSLWLPMAYRQLGPLPERKRLDKALFDIPKLAKNRPLIDWSTLANRLKSAMPAKVSHRVDLPRLVDHVARQKPIHQVPRLRRRTWPDEFFIVVDISDRMIPYGFDQALVVAALQKELSESRIHVLKCRRPGLMRFVDDKRRSLEYRTDQPPAFANVVVLSDLGLIGGKRYHKRQRAWQAWGDQQRRRGCRLTALVPCQPDQNTPRLATIFNVVHWQGNSGRSEPISNRESEVERLLAAAAPACRVEPGLLRDLRIILSIADASLESDFWLSKELVSNHPEAATLDEDAIERFRDEFERMDEDVRQQILHCIRAWHLPLDLGQRIWSLEYESLQDASQKLLPSSDRPAVSYCIDQLDVARRDLSTVRGRNAEGFVYRRSSVASSAAQERNQTVRDWQNEYHESQDLPTGTQDPREVPPGEARLLHIDLADQSVTATESFAPGPRIPQSHLSLNSSNGVVRVCRDSIEAKRTRFWKTTKPDFVSDFGRDEFGAWCEVAIPSRDDGRDVTVKFRWIPAGTFLMGSPEGDKEGFSDERPQHEVTISSGFWMAETACTQELWEAVTGENPSHFKGNELPVEHVSWVDTQMFFSSVAERVPELQLTLPTEAQWEYACRAGTTTSYHFGDKLSKSLANFSGSEFGQTVAAKSYSANPWGLFQTHGNVWEWCVDWWDENYYKTGPATDPSGPGEGSRRVVRGGGWGDDARYVRSAYRGWSHPGARSSSLGFRCMSSAIAEPTEGAEVPVAEQGSERTRGGGAEHVIRTSSKHADDAKRENLDLQSTLFVAPEPDDTQMGVARPDWAVDYGRDNYGVFASFEVKAVQQKMRWIPAGQFYMGSPETEEGRFDREHLHQVSISEGFWFAETTCTQKLWTAVMGDNPSNFRGDERPVENVSWNDVQQFFNEVKGSGLELQFSTEAQWEYACRAGTGTRYNFGNDIGKENANFGRNVAETVPVLQYTPNAWGLYQMHGNVWEWCADWWDENYYKTGPATDPSGPERGSIRVIRGGGWYDDAGYVRSAFRFWYHPGVRFSGLGFRCMSSAIAEPTEGAEVPVAEQGSERTRGGGAEHVFRASSKHADDAERKNLSFRTSWFVSSDIEEVQLQRLTKPDWAVEFGRDRYGAFATFAVEDVRQKMRWIPPGQFMMGSPEDEPGRYDRELQHPVTISEGFWMFNTPCTQALWLAVMKGKNPSRFQDPERPVEQVSWDDANDFCDKLSSKVSALQFKLPSEAQWEYACRAGTTTALYSGAIEILGDANAPELDEIAWYGGNSGYEFDIENPQSVQDFTWLSEKQYEFDAAGTRKIGVKVPNPWGMYDMLGNVWEWCGDWWDQKYYESSPAIDPAGPEGGSDRVIRGGGWRSNARFVRSAYRHWNRPGARNDNLGFRCMSSAIQ